MIELKLYEQRAVLFKNGADFSKGIRRQILSSVDQTALTCPVEKLGKKIEKTDLNHNKGFKLVPVLGLSCFPQAKKDSRIF